MSSAACIFWFQGWGAAGLQMAQPQAAANPQWFWQKCVVGVLPTHALESSLSVLHSPLDQLALGDTPAFFPAGSFSRLMLSLGACFENRAVRSCGEGADVPCPSIPRGESKAEGIPARCQANSMRALNGIMGQLRVFLYSLTCCFFFFAPSWNCNGGALRVCAGPHCDCFLSSLPCTPSRCSAPLCK